MGKEAVSAVPLLFVTRIMPDNGGSPSLREGSRAHNPHLSPTALSAYGAVSLSGSFAESSRSQPCENIYLYYIILHLFAVVKGN